MPESDGNEPGRVGFTSKDFKEDVVILEKREYNGFGQLAYLYRDTGETRFAYRPSGLRHREIFADGASRTHVWDGPNIIAELDDSGDVADRYIRGNGLVQSDNHGYYLHNAHGDVVGLTDAAGNPIKSYDYDAFGNEITPDPDDANPFRYCGEYWDAETGTYYLRNRCYAAYNRRFTQEDPIRSGLNWYAYADNNPLTYVDRSGLTAMSARHRDDQYTLFVAPQWLGATQTAAGLIPFFTPLNAVAQRTVGGLRPINVDYWAISGSITDVADAAFRTKFGYIGTGLEAIATINDWLGPQTYRINEAIFNHYNRNVWHSSSRDIVDTKFVNAFAWMAEHMTTGNLEIRRAIDVFGADAFHDHGRVLGMRSWQYDPLTGRNKLFSQDGFYFFMLDDSMRGYFNIVKDALREFNVRQCG